MALKIGEKYLVVEILGGLKVAAFRNHDKKKDDNQPDFKGNGLAIWINKKQAPKEEEEILEDLLENE